VEEGLTPPLFILAPPRSFTSVTCAMVGSHPQMLGLAETKLFIRDTVGELQEFYDVRESMQHGLLRSLAEIAFQEQTVETIEAVRNWLAENRDMSTAELFRTMQEWVGGRGLIDKSPAHVYAPAALQRIQRDEPEARYLHLTRHPGDMVKSVFQLREKIRSQRRQRFAGVQVDPRGNAGAPDKMWLEPHLIILEFLESVPPRQQMRLRGEDLLSDPTTYLRQIAEWLEIDTADSDIEAMMHPENSPFAAPGPANARYGNDPNFMEHPHLRQFTAKASPLAWQNPAGETLELSDAVRAYAMMFGY
jgi:hypothetical protein